MKKFLNGFRFAFKGLSYAFGTQVNFRFHTAATIIVVALGWYLKVSVQEWFWLIACIVLVLILELINTALEILVDLVSPGYNVKAGHIKDISAATVLVAAIFSSIVGLVIFIPKF